MGYKIISADKFQALMFLFIEKHILYKVPKTGRNFGFFNDNGRLDCVVNFGPLELDINEKPHSIEMKIVTTPLKSSFKLFTKKNIGFIFNYPFTYLGVSRVESYSDVKDASATKFNKQLGFKCDGLLRQKLPNKSDALIHSMLKTECKWLYGIHETKDGCAS